MEQTKTKKALIMSVLSVFLCIAMLIGMTFAWFTDTASTGVNKIVAGNLKVDIIGVNSDNHVEKLNFTKAADGATEEEILWEPGCRYLTEGFRIANKGDLALKWKVQVNKGTTAANEGNFDLLDVIDFYLVTETNGSQAETSLDEFSGNLNKSETSDVYYIKGVMQTTAGNDYQNLSLDGITITVYATQLNSENDSYGPDYDKNATYSVADYAALKEKFEGSGVYNVTKDVDVEDTLALTGYNALTLNATGKTISNTSDIWDTDKGSWSLVSARGSSMLTIVGGEFKAKANDCYAVDVQDGATVTIKDGTFNGNIHAVYVYKGTANIKGGFYSVQQKYPTAGQENEFVLNCYDANYTAGAAKIIVTGGTFVNFNPADCQAEGLHTNFVADGYKVVSETKSNGDVWYTVVKE